MSLKWKELEEVLAESAPILLDSVVQKAVQSEILAAGDSFTFQGFGPKGPWRLWLCLKGDHCCIALLPHDLKPDSAKEPSTFVMVLRKHLLGRRIIKVQQLERERILVFVFDSGHALVAELIPNKGNLVLLENWQEREKQGRCLGSFQQVSLESGGIYLLPPPPPVSPENKRDFFQNETESEGANFLVARHYWGLVESGSFQVYKRAWRQNLKSVLKKVKTARENTQADIAQAKEAEAFQKRGMLLVANLYQLGAKKLPKEKEIILEAEKIPLDLGKSFSENAEILFKKAKKLQRAGHELKSREQELLSKEQELEVLSKLIEQAADEMALESLAAKFKKAGVKVPEKTELFKEEVSQKEAKEFLEVESSDGFRILCGRNQDENRAVTFRESKGNDIWLHVKGMPGAHVAVKSQKNKTVPLSTLLEAAQLALYHSKIRKGKRAEVDYTFRKNVKPIKGTYAEVTYTGNKTLYVEADAELIKKILRA